MVLYDHRKLDEQVWLVKHGDSMTFLYVRTQNMCRACADYMTSTVVVINVEI